MNRALAVVLYLMVSNLSSEVVSHSPELVHWPLDDYSRAISIRAMAINFSRLFSPLFFQAALREAQLPIWPIQPPLPLLLLLPFISFPWSMAHQRCSVGSRHLFTAPWWPFAIFSPTLYKTYSRELVNTLKASRGRYCHFQGFFENEFCDERFSGSPASHFELHFSAFRIVLEFFKIF